MSTMICIKVTEREDDFKWSATLDGVFVGHGAAPSDVEALAYAAVATVHKMDEAKS